MSVKDISEKSKILESNGYKGMLLPFGQYMGDYFTKIARALDTNSSFEYIVAIRPHSVSAQYLSMITESVSCISPKRISINFVAGHIHDYEMSYGGILQQPDDFSSNDDRKSYLVKYVKEFSKITLNKKYRPKIMVSGFSEEVAKVVNESADCIIMNYKMFEDNRSAFDTVNKRKMISFSPLVRDTIEEIDNIRSIIKFEPNDIFYGTPKEFINFIQYLKDEGVTDIMISQLPEDNDSSCLYNAVKDLNLLYNKTT